MLGEKELNKLFPDFKGLIQPSGIDLRLDEVFIQKSAGSLINDDKNLPKLDKLEPPMYTLKSKTAYSVTVEPKIKIPKGCSMLYLPRSTINRSFISIHTAVGDPGFYGTLQFLLYNYGEFDYTIKQGERIVQAVVFNVTGSGEYNGSYQEKQD